MEYDSFKILVVGDSGVGKTALVHLLCHCQPLYNPAYTVGCSLDVKLHHVRSDYGEQRLCSLEFWDIGGSSCHENTRSVFYNNVQGLMLVYDCTNSKSQVNLKKWLTEVQQKTPSSSLEAINVSCSSSGSGRMANLLSRFTSGNMGFMSPTDGDCSDAAFRTYASASLSDNSLYPFPVLVVGTKVDLLSSSTRRKIVAHYATTQQNTDALSQESVTWFDNQSVYSPQSGGKSQTHSGSVHINVGNSPASSAPLVSRLFSQRSGEVGSFADEHGLPEILLNCNSLASTAPACYNTSAIEMFYDQIVHNKGVHSPDINKLQARINRSMFPVSTCSVPVDNGYHSQSIAADTLFWRKVM